MFNNEIIWTQANPRKVEPRRPQIKFEINGCGAMIGSKILVPYISEPPQIEINIFIS